VTRVWRRVQYYRSSALSLLLNVVLVAYWTASLFRAFSWLELVCNLMALVGVGLALYGLALNHRTAQIEREIEERVAGREREFEQWQRDILEHLHGRREQP